MTDRSLRCVVLDRIYDIWEDPTAQRLFHDLVNLKRSGFGKEYGYGVLPVDTHDLTSTHFAICEEAAQGLVPLMGARITTLQRSRLFNLPFPPTSLCALAAAPYHGSAFQQLIEHSLAKGLRPAYWGLWTIHPDARADKELSAYLVKCLGGMGQLLAKECGINDQILGATLRFKVDRVARLWGFEPLALDGEPLPPLDVAHLLGESVLLMVQREVSEYLRQIMEEMLPMWENRLVIAPGGHIDDLPPNGAPPSILVPNTSRAPEPDMGPTYLPSLLYARERYGALPEIPPSNYVLYLQALLVVLGAEGSISRAAWTSVTELIRKLGLSERVVQALKRFDWRTADLGDLLRTLGDSTVARRMLYDAARIAHEDGFSDAEDEALGRIAATMGVTADVVTAIVGLVRTELALRDMRASILFPERYTGGRRGSLIPAGSSAA
jgi:tellurite resistance protein